MQIAAPAKNLDIALAAVNHGADAVYMGAPQWSARAAAGNTFGDIEKAVKYAHRYRAKVYLALNTILFDNELDLARRFAHQAYEVGCDALIVQDMAFCEMDLPPIPLHASTQCHNLSLDKILFLQNVGFRQVVLARELSLAQIAHIHKHTSLALETFVHGSLCVSHSGQCYLSCALTGRSANRGECAQLCRAAYNLIDAQGKVLQKNKHLLSLADLNASQYLQALAEAGVSCIKIEGRLKDIDYVKNIVAYYRRQVDALLANTGKPRASSGAVHCNFVPHPQKTFSRGNTTYFLEGCPTAMANLQTPKSLGEEVGRVVRVETQGLRVSLRKGVSLANGDGLCFVNNKGQASGSNVNGVQGSLLRLQNTAGIAAGTVLYRNFDIVFHRQLMNPKSALRQIAVRLTFALAPQQISLTATDEDGVTCCIAKDYEFVAAHNAAQAAQQIDSQLRKNSHPLFCITKVDTQWEQTPFYPLSVLNQWRQEVLEELEKTRENRYLPEQKSLTKNDLPYPKNILDYSGNVANRLAAAFYRRHSVQHIAPAFEQKAPADAALMTCSYCLLRELNQCKKQHPNALHEPLFLENNGQKLRLHFDCSRCQMTITAQ